MAVLQKFNKRTNAWVKFKIVGGKSRIINVKERNPAVPFKGIKRMKGGR